MTAPRSLFVPHWRSSAYEDAGWTPDLLGPPDGSCSVLMVWPHDREPEYPPLKTSLLDDLERQQNLRDFDEIFGLGGDGE